MSQVQGPAPIRNKRRWSQRPGWKQRCNMGPKPTRGTETGTALETNNSALKPCQLSPPLPTSMAPPTPPMARTPSQTPRASSLVSSSSWPHSAQSWVPQAQSTPGPMSWLSLSLSRGVVGQALAGKDMPDHLRSPTAPGPGSTGSPWPTQCRDSGVTKRQPIYRHRSKVHPGGTARALARGLGSVISKNPFPPKLICYSKILQSNQAWTKSLRRLGRDISQNLFWFFWLVCTDTWRKAWGKGRILSESMRLN